MIKHLLILLTLALSTTTSFASSWVDDFESPDLVSQWTLTGTSPAEALVQTHNHTLAASATQSLLLGNLPGMASEAHHLPPDSSGNGIGRFWFYDNGAPVTGYKLGYIGSAWDTEQTNVMTSTPIHIGVRDTTGSILNQYIITTGNLTTPTGIMRTTGWHLAEFSFQSTGTHVLIDGNEFPGNTLPDVHYLAAGSFKTSEADTGVAAANLVWIDDYRQTYVVHDLDSRNVGAWFNDFETHASGWEIERGNFSFRGYRIHTGINHTPDHEATTSLTLDDSSIGKTYRIVDLAYNQPATGLLTLWFYDEGQSLINYQFTATGVASSTPEKIVGSSLTLGIDDNPTTGSNLYYVEYAGNRTPTSIQRTTGWHKLQFGVTPQGTEMRLNDHPLPGNIAPEMFRIAYLNITNLIFVQNADQAKFYIDDVSYQPGALLPPPNAANNWTLYQ